MLDANETGILTFRDLSCLLSTILKGNSIEKVTLFYKCHIPPAFNMSDLEDVIEIPKDSDEPELAMEASHLLGSAHTSPKKGSGTSTRSSSSSILEIQSGDAAPSGSEDIDIDVPDSIPCSSRATEIGSPPTEPILSGSSSVIKLGLDKPMSPPNSDEFSLPDKAASEISGIFMARFNLLDSGFSLVDENDALKALSEKVQSVTLQEIHKLNISEKNLEPISQVLYFGLFILYFRSSSYNYGSSYMT